jgi:hypothetical protein
MNHSKIVLCMKWGTLYPAEYVNVLYRACKRYISGDFRFVCLTGETQGLLPEVEVFPIPDIGLEHSHYYDGAWPKIGVFSSQLYGLQGRCLFIDLDTVILDNLDPLFELPGPLVAINNAPWSNPSLPPRTMSSVFAFDIGSLGHVVDQLKGERDSLVDQHKIEQEYLHHAVDGIAYWPQEWLVSFKYHLRQPLVLDRFLPPKSPPPQAKLVIFHGKPRPIDLVRPPRGNWERFPHYGSGAVDWMERYWRDHSRSE